MKMMPGRELDALVAEKVLGWTRHREPNRGSGDDVDWNFYWVPKQFGGDIAYWRKLPHFSTDMSDAWVVVEQLREADPKTDFDLWEIAHDDDGDWGCSFYEPWYSCYGLTAPHAICLAALHAAQMK